MTRWKPALAAAAAFGALFAWTGAARGEVKAGVDAWSAGDFARAVAEWRGPAAKGDADALFNLAQAYRLGRGVPIDLKQAETYYARAAAKGHLKAADNYGLLLFQDGRREQALPYVSAAAERGDPRAQYLIGIAHFNGDLVAKDWVKAYALLTLANAAGLPQAGPAIRQMDQHVPLSQRQQAQALAAQIRASADARRSSEMAAADLGSGAPAIVAGPAMPAPAPAVAAGVPQPVARATVTPSIAAAEAAVAEAMRATGTESPATAGADYARPAPTARPARDLARATPPPSRPRTSAPPPTLPAPAADTAQGAWKLQLGAFSVAGNAQRAWSQVAGHAALAGKSRQTDQAGRLTRLLAAGWPTQGAAQAACNRLKAAGHSCLVTR
ncbi:MAG: SPOR domain-containing protein [Cypionkella sp.]